MSIYKNLRVVAIASDGLYLAPSGYTFVARIDSEQAADPDGASHYLWWGDHRLSDFEGMEFDITGDSFFRRIDGYGIELIAKDGRTVQVAGHGESRGDYSSEMSLCVYDFSGNVLKRYDITDCQIITEL